MDEYFTPWLTLAAPSIAASSTCGFRRVLGRAVRFACSESHTSYPRRRVVSFMGRREPESGELTGGGRVRSSSAGINPLSAEALPYEVARLARGVLVTPASPATAAPVP